MKTKYIGLILICLSIILSISNLEITGNTIGTKENISSKLVTTILLISGIFLIILEARSEKSSDLEILAWLPKECLKDGVKPGGWDPKEKAVPGFSAKYHSPEKIKKAFNMGDNVVLIKYGENSARNFYERLTGPERKFNGIYANDKYVPAEEIIQVDPKKYSTIH